MRTAIEQDMIGEMMLAKAVLEEGNEHLENADGALLSLRGRERALHAELAQLRIEAARLAARAEDVARSAEERGVLEAVCDVITAISAVEGTREAEAFVALLAEKHGVEAIETVSLPLDPRRFRVIERGRGPEDRIEVLRRGYRLGCDVLRPALVRVTVGV
jgi:molecular chaperone GrpE (heat shock protein)